LRVQINGETRQVADELSLADLIRDLSLTPQRVAVEVNNQIVSQTEWSAKIVNEGDRIEIVHFVGGGTMQPAVSRRQ